VNLRQELEFLSAGHLSKSSPLNYMTGCLFDTSSHHGSITTYIFDEATHSEKYKESWVMDRFGALWINYLWIEDPTPQPSAGRSLSLCHSMAN